MLLHCFFFQATAQQQVQQQLQQQKVTTIQQQKVATIQQQPQQPTVQQKVFPVTVQSSTIPSVQVIKQDPATPVVTTVPQAQVSWLELLFILLLKINTLSFHLMNIWGCSIMSFPHLLCNPN